MNKMLNNAAQKGTVSVYATPRGRNVASSVPNKRPSSGSGLPVLEKSSKDSADMRGDDAVKVLCRVRPLNKKELGEGGESVVSIREDCRTVDIDVGSERHNFTFDHALGATGQQSDVYEMAVKAVVDDVCDGYNGTVFAYGQTSSGKTHTMQGPDVNDPELRGAIPRMIEAVFARGRSKSTVEADTDIEPEVDAEMRMEVKVSMMEIYMERIKDLFDHNKDNLPIHEDSKRGIYVGDCTEREVTTEAQAMMEMQKGFASRAISSTSMNSESSRSHAVFVMNIAQHNRGMVKLSKLYLVDLAGSEKVGKTGASGQTLNEAKTINKSLSALGNVINALTDKHAKHVPYRDSKLTRMLQEAIGGNCRTTIIINLSPSHGNAEESLSTLRFGNRAKNIKNTPVMNKEMSMAEMKSLVTQQQEQLEQYKEIIAMLQAQLDGTGPMIAPQLEAPQIRQEGEGVENGVGSTGGGTLYAMPQGANLSNIAANMMSVNQEMSSEKARLRTFFPDWPISEMTPHTLAAAGLYYSPTVASQDRCICYCCHEVLFDWEPSDDPWTEHAKFSPDCPHLVRCKMDGRFGCKVVPKPFVPTALKEKGAAIATKAEGGLRWLFGVREDKENKESAASSHETTPPPELDEETSESLKEQAAKIREQALKAEQERLREDKLALLKSEVSLAELEVDVWKERMLVDGEVVEDVLLELQELEDRLNSRAAFFNQLELVSCVAFSKMRHHKKHLESALSRTEAMNDTINKFEERARRATSKALMQQEDDLSLITRVLDGAKRRQSVLEKDRRILEKEMEALKAQIAALTSDSGA
jgi:hypothetical protein